MPWTGEEATPLHSYGSYVRHPPVTPFMAYRQTSTSTRYIRGCSYLRIMPEQAGQSRVCGSLPMFKPRVRAHLWLSLETMGVKLDARFI
jgi:hypothetical protein